MDEVLYGVRARVCVCSSEYVCVYAYLHVVMFFGGPMSRVAVRLKLTIMYVFIVQHKAHCLQISVRPILCLIF